MSKLRNHLHQAKREYESLHYPGDLAADVMDPLYPPVTKSSHWLRHLAIAAGLALTATAAIVFVSRGGSANLAKDDSKTVEQPKIEIAKETPAKLVDPASQDEVAKQTDSVQEDETEESWSLVPTEVATAQESSLSLVPEYQSMSFSLPSISYVDDSIEEPSAVKSQ